MRRPILTLGQAFLLGLAALAVLLGLLFQRIDASSRESVVAGSERERQATLERIGQAIDGYLEEAERSIDSVERQVQFGSCDVASAPCAEAALFAQVLDDANLAEATLTGAVPRGFLADGRMRIAPERRWQVSVYRDSPQAGSPILTRVTFLERGRFVSELRRRRPGGGLLSAPLVRQPDAPPDPTENATFVGAASRDVYARRPRRALWSDLSHFELDARLPEPRRRVVVTAMRSVDEAGGGFVGVVRVGLGTEALDRRVREEAERHRPHRIILCDADGKLVTRLAPRDPLVEQPDTSLRFVPAPLPAEIGMALAHPGLREVGAERMDAAGRFEVAGRAFLVSFRALPRSQDWRLGVVVAQDELRGMAELVRRRNRLLGWSLLVMLSILAGGVLTLRAVRRGLGQIVDTTARMRDFDFRAAQFRSPFADVQAVMERLELAKTAMRALGKYVPIDLVRLLYRTGREPVLGGETCEVSLMFTDIEGFTALGERLPPNELAAALGRYFEVMTGAVHGASGSIDKYIGDAIMALWNAPTPCPGHARKACEAALACRGALEALFASAEWTGRPRLVTRFGLHRAEVMVGHFGAPDRMSYTALGDGVNLASRLEGLNKQYGTRVLASEAIHEEALAAFEFRIVDLVAVKGRQQGVRVYELLGRKGETPEARLASARRYAEAFEAYLRGDFGAALALAEVQADDPPSRVLAQRCRRLIEVPPPPDWGGVYVAASK
jgi:adenylate cyclase